eukprot:TRINITY_DN41543_c0_g1_i1.p1 TRINITY_DN41543_c0_g1~~TRINITY_DN41543_c0_g1_i1.p1  ORF type:complete len:523 (-),score=80.21 TRINITY_DN41543_c0_g1_i1:86-1654(-)
MDNDAAPPPPLKKARRSVSDFIRSRASQPQPKPFAGETAASEALVEASRSVSFAVESLADSFQEAAVDTAKGLELSRQAALQARQEHFEQLLRKDLDDPNRHDPKLTSSEDIVADLMVQSRLRLATPHASLRWLRRLPTALRCHSLRSQDIKGPVRDAAIELCQGNLPQLLANPDKAAAWLARIAACLSWYEADGPPRVIQGSSTANTGHSSLPADAAGKVAQQRIDEWDESFRSQWLLLRQGMLPCFSLLAERFSLSVFGEGSGPWTSSISGEACKPSQAEPCAVLWPSSYELRTLLQVNHVPFEMAPASALPQINAGEESLAIVAQDKKEEDVARAEDVARDVRELRRDGEKARLPEDGPGQGGVLCTALLFQGTRRVHALIDVLRQHFLGQPIFPLRPTPPQQLPLLLAPAPFANAKVKSADVLKTLTCLAEASGNSQTLFTAELQGRFFPMQLRRLLELFRVLLPSFSCDFTAPPRHGASANVFTQLRGRRIESVSCESVAASPDRPANWKWDFRIGH